MSDTQSSTSDTATEPQVIDLGDNTLDTMFALDGIVFTREVVVRALTKLNLRVQRLDDENGPRVYLLGDDREYSRAHIIRLIEQDETRRQRLQVHESASTTGSASTDNGVDPATRLTVLPDPHAPLIEDDLLTGTAYDNVVLGGERQQDDAHCYLPVLVTRPVQTPPRPSFGQRITNWWQTIHVQGFVASMEHTLLTAFGGLLVALSYFLLEHETYVRGNVVNNGTLYDVIGNSHLQLTALGIVLVALVVGTTDLVIHYLHHRPQNTQEIILMWRTFNLAVFKAFGILFLGIVALSILTGTPATILD